MKPEDLHRLRILVPRTPCAAPFPEPDAELPEWIHLCPIGEYLGHPTGGFVLSAFELTAIVENFNRYGVDLVGDYEHQTIHTEWNGQPAPASGWVDQLELREDGIWGHVRMWTEKAADHLRAREYRYLSPVLQWWTEDRHTGQFTGASLHSWALTNVPFLGGDLVPVINRTPLTEESMHTAILSLLALAATATDEEITQACEGFTALRDAARTAAGKPEAEPAELAVELAGLGSEAEIGRAACSAIWPNGAPGDAAAQLGRGLDAVGLVPMSKHLDALRSGDAALQDLTDDQVIKKAMEEGRLTPAQRGPFKAYLTSNRPAALAYLSSTPVRVPMSTPFPDGPPKGGGVSDAVLTDEEKRTAKAMGLTEEQVLATKKARLARAGGAA